MTLRVLILACLIASLPLAAKPCLYDCRVSDDGRKLVKKYEGFFPFVYKDAAGYPTIGFGHLMRPGESIEQPLLGEAADSLLNSDLNRIARSVNHIVLIDLHQAQFDALESFAFNLGPASLQRSNLLRYVNARRTADVPAQFRLWVYAGGKKLKGLVARRQAEAELFASGSM